MGKYQYPCLKQIDIFGIPPLFTIRGRPTFQTHIGSILTIICVTTILIYFIYLFTQMLCHKNPTFYSSIHYEEIPPEVKLSNNNFSFAFSLENFDYKNFIDNNVYNIKAFQTKLILQNDGSYKYQNTNLNIEKCNKITISYNYDKLPYDNLFCINDDIYLQGDYKTPIWNYVTFNFYKCENSTENNFSCKSENEINNLIKGGFIGMYISDYSFQPNNFDKPFKIFIKNLHRPFSIKYYKDIILYFKMVEIETDIGYFFEEKKKIIIPGFDYIQDDSKYEYENPNNFLSLNIKFSLKKEIHKRSYLKLQNIFSNVGGTMKLILLFGEYSVYFIRITLYKNYILEFFNLDESEIRLKEVREKYSSIRKHLSTQSKINILTLSNLSNNNSFVLNNNNINNSKNNNNNNIHNSNIIVPNNMLNQSQCKYNSLIHQSKMQLQINNKNSPLSPSKNSLKINNIFYTPRKSVNQVNNFFLRPPTVFENNEIKRSTKTSQFNIINNETREIKKKNSLFVNNTSIKMLQSISIPKTKVRIIKIPSFWKDFLCKKKTCVTIKKVNNNYKEIQFLLDIVHYLKSENTLNIIIKYFFSEEQRKALSYTYTFETDFELEKIGYEYMIKHKKNLIENPN